MDNYNDEIPKYRKKKSSVSSASKKSKHKHIYKDCLLIMENGPHNAFVNKKLSHLANKKVSQL